MPVSPTVPLTDSRAVESAIIDRLTDGQWWPFEALAASVGAHSRDVTLALQRLRQNGFVEAEGEKRAKRYRLPDVAAATRAYAEPLRLPLTLPEPAPAPPPVAATPAEPAIPLSRLEETLAGYESRLASLEAEVAAMRQLTSGLQAEIRAAMAPLAPEAGRSAALPPAPAARPEPVEPASSDPPGSAVQPGHLLPPGAGAPAGGWRAPADAAARSVPQSVAPALESAQERILRLRRSAADEARWRAEALERKIQAGVPAPLLARAERGFELMNARGVLAQAEFAWLDRRVALLMPIQRGERPAFEKHGWTVFDASALAVTDGWNHLTRVLAA